MTILYIIWLSVWTLIVFRFSYDKGYEDREKKFQSGPIQFNVGVEAVMHVEHTEGVIKVRYQNKKLIKELK